MTIKLSKRPKTPKTWSEVRPGHRRESYAALRSWHITYPRDDDEREFNAALRLAIKTLRAAEEQSR